MRVRSLILLLILLVACSGANDDHLPEHPPTLTPQPTATPVPLGEIDLASLMFVDGDLPAEYILEDSKPPINRGASELKPLATLMQDYRPAAKQFWSPRVTTILEIYRTTEEARQIYEADLEAPSWQFPNDYEIGDAGTIELKQLAKGDPKSNAFRLAFVRCQALAYTVLTSSEDHTILLAYAERLDARLKAVVCRPEEPLAP